MNEKPAWLRELFLLERAWSSSDTYWNAGGRIVWDGSEQHRSLLVRDFVTAQPTAELIGPGGSFQIGRLAGIPRVRRRRRSQRSFNCWVTGLTGLTVVPE